MEAAGRVGRRGRGRKGKETFKEMVKRWTKGDHEAIQADGRPRQVDKQAGRWQPLLDGLKEARLVKV